MAINSDLIIYDDPAQTAFPGRRQDNLGVFDATSNGAVILDNELIKDDLHKRTFCRVGGSIGSCNVSSIGPVMGEKIGASESVSVKAPWKYGPYETTEEAFKCRGCDVSEFFEVIGVGVTDATLEGYIKYALQDLVAATGTNASMTVSAGIATGDKKTLTHDLHKYGNKLNRVTLSVTHSTTYFNTVDQAINNEIYEEADVAVYGRQPGTLGKPVLVTNTMPVDVVLELVAGAISITESQVPGFRSYDINDQEDLATGYRAEDTVNVELLGYSWGETKDANPDLTKIGTGADWKKHPTSNKPTAGILTKLETPAGE